MTNRYSLRRRLLVSAAALLILFLGAMGWALNRAFEQSVLSNAEDALRNQVLLLMANIDVEDQDIVVPESLSEPRLSQTESTLYAQITIPDRGIVWRSPSLLDMQLGLVSSRQGEFLFFPDSIWEGPASIYQLSFGAAWETDSGDLPFTVQVAEHRNPYLKRMRQYRGQLAIWLSIMGVSLLVLLLLLLSWGLQPLVRVTRQVEEIEQGNRLRFDEDYPQEVSRLTQNLNQLLNFEQQRIERQKNVLGNLAHSLKTPLAVLKGIEYSDQNRGEVNHQLGAMQNIIDYQLQSASAVGRRRFSRPVEIVEPSRRLISSIQKLYREKNLACDVSLDVGTQFFGDEGDWLDLIGNLLDNAFKWADSKVELEVHNEEIQGQSDSHRRATIVRVLDDGAGIDDALKQTILERGVRLDSQTPGHGLGLHIVKGIVEAYEGEFEISNNHPRGTIFKVTLN